jgi:dTMP kinase
MFITFEGLDGSGKSTQAQRLVDRLEAAGCRTLLVREPGGTGLSERIRALLLDPDLAVVPMAELLLFAAARAQLVEARIRPALAEGVVVVCDRFFDSTTAYQGAGRGLGGDPPSPEMPSPEMPSPEMPNHDIPNPVAPTSDAQAREASAWLHAFNRRVTGGLVPDRTYLLELTPGEARHRRRARTPADDRMEAAASDFHDRVGAAYARLAAAEPDRFRRLRATAAAEHLHEQIWQDVQALLGTGVSGAGSPM